MSEADRVLAGRHAVVTGASRGIGAAIADELARRGADVTLLGRDAGALEAHAAAISGRHGVKTLPLQCDVADAARVESVFADAVARMGDPQILVNNAGQADAATFLDTTPQLWQRMLSVNLMGPVHCTRAVLPAMLAARRGRIVNIASMAGLTAYALTSAYTASKHALVGLTRALALEVRKHGITANAVCPGYTDTDMAALAEQNLMAALHKSAAEARAIILRRNPRGELIHPEEVARAVAWLCTDAASAINGQAIPVAGGEA